MTAFEMLIDGQPIPAARDAVLLHELTPPLPPTPAVETDAEPPLTAFLWTDPGGNFTGQVFLGVAVTAEEARELLVLEAAEGDELALEHFRAWRRGERLRPLGAYRNVWAQLVLDPQRLTRPTAMRLRHLVSPGTAHS